MPVLRAAVPSLYPSRHGEPGLKTDRRGIATIEGDAKVAYFKNPDGHTLSIAQPARSRASLDSVYSPECVEEEFCELGFEGF